MATSQVDLILTQVQQLPPSDQIQLIQRLMGLLTKARAAATPRGLVYGKYQNASGGMSTEEDFELTEWHLSDKDVNGE